MPFKRVEIKSKIEEKATTNAQFRTAWENSRNEYELLHNVTKIRKELNLTQKDLAVMSNSTQQEISRLEKREHSPALKTICRIVNSMGYELVLRKKI